MSAHYSQLNIEAFMQACQVRRQRRSGPGGQHRNKVETGIFVTHLPTGIRAEATEGRSQKHNLELAVFRLRVRISLEHRSSEPNTTPTDLWKSRLKSGRVSISRRHPDFPALLAEALDTLHQFAWQVPPTSAHLGCSSSQLIKFLKLEPQGLLTLNRRREEIGLSKLQ